MPIEDTLIFDIKEIINKGNLATLQAHYTHLQSDYDWSGHSPDWPYVLQKVYIHACLKRQRDMAAWLEGLFASVMDPIQQIAYRHTLNYGRILLRR
jgi:hypothetical protein